MIRMILLMLVLAGPLALQDPLDTPDLRIEGLRAGERFRTLVSSPAVNRALERFGRVVDAKSGNPVEGARVQTWTEEISGPGQGFHRVGEAETTRDGNFRVPILDGAVEAEKIRVSKPGYLAFPGTLADLDLVQLMPRPAWTSELRVVDLMDQPIEGAQITSTYSCAHDVPAFEVTTNEEGLAELPEYGLQDHPGELRIRASGYGARKYVPWREVCGPGPEPVVIRLPRQRASRAVVLDRNGAPLAGATLHIVDGDGYHAPTTDSRGAFELASRFDGSELTLFRLSAGADSDEFLFAGRLPSDREVSVRGEGTAWPDATPLGHLRVEVARHLDVPISVFHSEGWTADEVPAEGLDFPAGRILVLVGGAFTGFAEELFELELEDGAQLEFAVLPRHEPTLEILAEEGTRRIWVQAGDETLELEGREEQRITVPAGRPLALLCEGERTRRLILRGVDAPAIRVDLRPEELMLPAARRELIASTPRQTLRVRVAGNGRGRLNARGVVDTEVTTPGPDEFEVQGPIGYPLLLSYEADGYAECWTTTVPEIGEIQLEPARLARLSIVNETGCALAYESIDADALTRLHPGPLSLTLRLDDGRRGMLKLELAPGEERVLTLRD